MSKQWVAIRGSRATISSAMLGLLLIGVSATDIVSVKLVWNASSSAPKGLYAIKHQAPSTGDLVLVQLPEWASLIAERRGYLPSNVPALKRVFALAGDRVCRVGSMIIVNGKAIAWARFTDNLVRRLPSWHGCLTLASGQVFLLADHRYSFDGRYFGVTKLADILGIDIFDHQPHQSIQIRSQPSFRPCPNRFRDTQNVSEFRHPNQAKRDIEN